MGSETSRFRQFLRPPKSVVRYLLGKEKEKPGHNPAGGWMVITLLSALTIQCVSGLALAGLLDHLPYANIWLNDSVFSLLENIHLTMVKVLPTLVALHVLAVFFYKLRSKPLTWTMVTGFQTKIELNGSVTFVSQWRALGVLALAALLIIMLTVLA